MADTTKKSNLALIEEQMLATWQSEGTFQKSLEQTKKTGKIFNFYDGPPFANGLPHFGHSLVTSIKDSLGRYKTMQGYYVERRNGWDCHGLPVEFAIEKQLGVSGKKQVLELGLEKFNAACRDSIFMYKGEWEQFFERIGRWTDTANAYATVNPDYTESVWWVLKQVNDKGLLYKGYKSMPYCPRCETPLSNFEVNEGYRDDVPDPSLYVKFKLADEDASLLAWTTTPWSLPGNAAIGVKPDETYVYAAVKDEHNNEETLIIAKKRLESIFKDEATYKVIREVKGLELVGKVYEPLFPGAANRIAPALSNLYKVWSADAVSTDEGTGVLHVAPAFGEEDLKLAHQNGIPILLTIDDSGKVISDIGLQEAEGKFFKTADKIIIAYLTEKGAVFAAETIKHTYPFCYRCETPLLYYAISTWFIRVSAIKDDLLRTAEQINWTPEHINDGRFGKWLEGARDWAISRNRYWGAPMPIWANIEDKNDYLVVGNTTELRELADPGVVIDDLHRPFIDQVVIHKDGKTYKRIEEVLDCWFESGSMPMAQHHFPFDNKDKMQASFPADYIGEGLDQTRLWFYVLHVLSTIIFDQPAYKNVLVNGMIMAADGQKLSKRLKNYPPVDEVLSQEGADALRLYLLSNNQAVSADYMRFNRDAMKDLNRNVLGTLMNSFRFFDMYAQLDNWKPVAPGTQPITTNVLDQWMLVRLNETIAEVTKQADGYKLAHAINPIFLLIEDMSNWFIRRSRRRFWKSEDDTDKQSAYETLWFTLLRVTQLLAPWAPFLSDHIWRQLVKDTDLPSSVHLSDWPKAIEVDSVVLEEMTRTRQIVEHGLAQRMLSGDGQQQIKVRQPLNTLIYTGLPLRKELELTIAEEVNVKQVVNEEPDNEGPLAVSVDKNITPELRREGLMREVVRQVQNARKQADLQVEDRIILSLDTSDKELNRAVQEFEATIAQETLANLVTDKALGGYEATVKIEGVELTIKLKKAN